MYKVVGDDKKNDNCPALHISYYRRRKIDVFRNVMKTPIKQFKLLITNKCQTRLVLIFITPATPQPSN